MDKKIHLEDTIKSALTTFFINYGECEDENKLNEALHLLEVDLRFKANYYIKRKEYDADDVLDVLGNIKDSKFLEQGLEGVDFKNKTLILKKLDSMFKNLFNLIHILKNWS